MKITVRAIVVLLVLLAAGCAQPDPTELKPLPEFEKPVIEAPVPQTAGSLWTTANGSLFVDNRAKRVGDILTVAIYERAEANKKATTDTDRETTVSADMTKFFGLEKNIKNINSAIDPAHLISAGYKNEFKGSGSTTRKENLVATLTTRVVEVLPNGTLRISGSKSVTVNHEQQIIHLSGIVRPQDITPNNVVDSKYVLDANIVYTGNGVIDDKQQPGWLLQLLDKTMPF
ncbi:MAG: flagellar biosynthesis protein FlgH [Desulfobacteraceae bacterium 4572_35.1]|nr:MAG: flagellar biosynthesis protein FlgH [Desulfobacteraceae bacterium 4572_35.1]